MKDEKDKEEQLELDLGGDNQAEEEVVVVEDDPELSEETSDKKGVSLEDGIGELRAQLERERQARMEAETRAKEAAMMARRAKSEVDDTNLHLVNSAINEVKRENLWYKGAIREALEKGDYDRATEYQEAMLVNVNKLNKLEEGKVAMETRPRQEAVASDPVEMFASQLSPRSADWVRRNPQFVTDPRLNQKMIAAHNLAVADGYAPDTDDYFAFVEDTLKMNRREPSRPVADDQYEDDSALSSASKPVQRRSAPPAAPVSRTPASPSGNRTPSNGVRLTKEQIEAAKISGLTPQEYYAQVQREKRRSDGRYN